ncbi:hydantoinase B/oxoprolinase family protein [Novosphingobium sp. UBA1939]|uniref:hydantoinase B/oxoprolinase family protein n=1 Tax=Novosphingobium sp. UBA1939 TaxID=1946982 RepID=UPI0025E29603|nr:hydantoinase B/oxoprolinase family protein [Novosphingobium sp. UBA1939]
MTAKIIQPNTASYGRVDVNVVTVDIIENALRNARSEMDAVIFRTAMSPGIREQHDAFPIIANSNGLMVVGQFGSFIHGFLKAYDGEIEEGDVFLTNDPYSCNGAVSHLNDWLVLMPIFHGGRLAAWAAMFGHMTDTGGRVPGSLPTDAQQIFEEGIQIPPVKIMRGSVLADEILKICLRNSRVPEWNRADLMALIAAVKLAERRIHELSLRFGADTLYSAMELLLERNLNAFRRVIREVVPETPVSFEDYIDDDGMGNGPYKIACSMWREGDRAIFDFAGTDPQSSSSVNYYLQDEQFKMIFGAYTSKLFDPQIVFNDGYYELIDVRIPEGSLLRPRRPAALSCRTHLLCRMFDLVSGLLGQGKPEAMCGAGWSASPHLMYSGSDAKGDWFQLYQIGFGGLPARPVGDGVDGHSLWPSFMNIPTEYLEAYFPLVIRHTKIIPDSGGPGLHRGGNGISIAYEFREPGEISIHDDRWMTRPWGVNGGKAAGRSKRRLNRITGTSELVASKCDRIKVTKGDVLVMDTWGGGGWGDPLKRQAKLVTEDARNGLITRDGARDYGVVLDAAFAVDELATAALRARMAAEAGSPQSFDFGGTIEELVARCEAETGMPAPRRPIAEQNAA